MSGQNVFFDISINNDPAGRITFRVRLTAEERNCLIFLFILQLFDDVVPKTAGIPFFFESNC